MAIATFRWRGGSHNALYPGGGDGAMVLQAIFASVGLYLTDRVRLKTVCALNREMPSARWTMKVEDRCRDTFTVSTLQTGMLHHTTMYTRRKSAVGSLIPSRSIYGGTSIQWNATHAIESTRAWKASPFCKPRVQILLVRTTATSASHPRDRNS